MRSQTLKIFGILSLLLAVTLTFTACDMGDNNDELGTDPDPHGLQITVSAPEALLATQGEVDILTIEDNVDIDKVSVELYKEDENIEDETITWDGFDEEHEITFEDVEAGDEYKVEAELIGTIRDEDEKTTLYEGETEKFSVAPDVVAEKEVEVKPLDAESLEVTIEDSDVRDRLEEATLKHPSEDNHQIDDLNNVNTIEFARDEGYKPSRWHLELEFQDYDWVPPTEVLLLPTEEREVTIGIETDYIEAQDVTVTAGDTGRINVVAYDRNENPVPGETIRVTDDDGLGGIDEDDEDVTNLEGVARFDFEEEDDGTYEVEFSVEDEDITDTATVEVEAVDVGDEGKINEWDDLNDIRNNLDEDYELQDDLDYDDWDDAPEDGWEPIGNDEERFTGTFDGNGYTIENLEIDREDEDNVGLFGHVGDDNDASTIRNVCIEDADVTGGRGTGILIGRVTGNSDTLIEQACATGDVEGTGATGGLIGSFNSHRATQGGTDNPVLRQSYADVDVNYDSANQNDGIDKFGGLVGCGQKGTIINSYAWGSVTISSEGERIGGLAGCVDYRGILENTYSTGEVAAEDSDSVGGLVGNVEGVGGNAGEIIDSMSLKSDEYYVIGVEGRAELTGRVTDAPEDHMEGEELYTGVDFNDYDDLDDPWDEDIWHIEEDDNEYPTLEWQED